jgi:hypothetical protein
MPRLNFYKNEVSEHASLLTLHQNGRDTVALRLDDLEAKRIADAATAVAK